MTKKIRAKAKFKRKTRRKTIGEVVATELIKPAGPGAIYIGPMILFRRPDDAEEAISWIREIIAAAVDAALSASTNPKR
jgi:hypothetical protein